MADIPETDLQLGYAIFFEWPGELGGNTRRSCIQASVEADIVVLSLSSFVECDILAHARQVLRERDKEHEVLAVHVISFTMATEPGQLSFRPLTLICRSPTSVSRPPTSK